MSLRISMSFVNFVSFISNKGIKTEIVFSWKVILACPVTSATRLGRESFRLVRNLKKDSRQAGMTTGLAYVNDKRKDYPFPYSSQLVNHKLSLFYSTETS